MTYEVGSRKPKVGDKVLVVQKKDYASGQLTSGVVKDVLTSKEFHPRGHKVRLTSGIIGRVQKFADQVEEEKSETKQPSSAHYTPAPDDLV
jgi:uncharacterized repeat protein (TIGR03833 family)